MNERDAKRDHRLVWLVLLGSAAAVVGLLLASVAVLADDQHMHGGAPALSWYPKLKTPLGGSCCSDRDCQPTSYCTAQDGREGIVVTNGGQSVCRAMPYDRLIPAPPDVALGYDEVHACWEHTADPRLAKIWCVIGGLGT